MKKEVWEIFERQGYKNTNLRVLLSVIIVIIAAIIFILVFFYLNPKPCNDNACFMQSLAKCNRISFLKEDSRASWYYLIEGKYDKDSCKVKVKLLKMNQGTIDIEDLQGAEMACIVNRMDARPPEENMAQCQGLLKEKLQEIIIQRMHSYLLKNLGEVKESFLP